MNVVNFYEEDVTFITCLRVVALQSGRVLFKGVLKQRCHPEL